MRYSLVKVPLTLSPFRLSLPLTLNLFPLWLKTPSPLSTAFTLNRPLIPLSTAFTQQHPGGVPSYCKSSYCLAMAGQGRAQHQ